MAFGMDSGEAKADINVTPLIDVLLVLLIIFMVVTPAVAVGVLPKARTALGCLPPSPPKRASPRRPDLCCPSASPGPTNFVPH